jgi:hypothetical protein
MRLVRILPILTILTFPLLASQQDDDDERLLLRDYPALAGNAIAHKIAGFGTCSFFTSRGERWSASFAGDASLSLRCEPAKGGILPGFHLWYTDVRGMRFEIAKCIFNNGFNQGWYFTDENHADQLLRVVWQNIDGGKNDGGLRRLDREHVTGPEEPYIDVVFWVFDPAARKLNCISEKYRYQTKLARLPQEGKTRLEPYMGPRVAELRRSFVKTLG